LASLGIDPDFGQLLSFEDRAIARRLSLRVSGSRGASGRWGADVNALLAEARVFGAIVVEGMLVHRRQVADQVGLRLLGAGDMVQVNAIRP